MKKTIIIIASVLAVLGGIYLGGFALFSHYTMPNTTLYNVAAEEGSPEKEIKAGMKSEKSVSDTILSSYAQKLKLKLWDNHTSEIAILDSADKVKIEEAAKGLIAGQKPAAWPVEIWKDKRLVFNNKIYLTEGTEEKIIERFPTEGMGIPSENAKVGINEKGEAVVIPETSGTEVDKEKLSAALDYALTHGRLYVSYEDSDIYKDAEILSNDESLIKEAERLNVIFGRTIILNLVDAEESVLAGYFYDADVFNESGELAVNEDKLEKYVRSLKEKYDTYETSRKFRTHDGKWIEVGGVPDDTDDTYGFSLDVSGTMEVIHEALEEEADVTRDVSWNMKGHLRDENGDIGNTYIEISLEEQKLYYFDNGEQVLETSIVTGLPTASRHTPAGVYAIYSKGRNINLIGTMDGESWNSFVNYWMSVTWTEIGIHDAPWRNAFGGEIYKTNGSHGCINLPYDAEQWLYNNTDMGTIVVIY